MSVNYKKENQTIVLLGKILTHISHTLSSLKSSSAINEDFEIEKQRRRRKKKNSLAKPVTYRTAVEFYSIKRLEFR